MSGHCNNENPNIFSYGVGGHSILLKKVRLSVATLRGIFHNFANEMLSHSFDSANQTSMELSLQGSWNPMIFGSERTFTNVIFQSRISQIN